MDKEIQEYVALRKEVNDLCSSADNIISMLYAFLTAYLAFIFNKEDTAYLLFSYVVLIPVYLLIISKRIASCKISAYISVFHEKTENMWENRLMAYNTPKKPFIFSFIEATHFPFVFINFFILFFYFIRFKIYDLETIYGWFKLVLLFLFFIITYALTVRYRKISVCHYVNEWKRIQNKENESTQNINS